MSMGRSPHDMVYPSILSPNLSEEEPHFSTKGPTEDRWIILFASWSRQIPLASAVKRKYNIYAE
jgi:hypothetical protein